MRILSQEKLGLNYDIPYEQVCLNINKKSENSFRIYAWNSLSNSDDSCYLVAEYSTEAKARKAMEMLHEAYTGIPLILQNVDISEDVREMFEKWKNQGIFVVSENQPSKVEYVGNVLFRFPADDEAEV